MNTILVSCANCSTRNRIPAVKQHLGPKCGKCKSVLDLTGFAMPVELSEQIFDEVVLQAELPVMVDFFSPTCGPCRTLAPVIAKLAGKFLGRAVVAKLDTTRNSGLAGRYGIRGVPTLLFFKNGRLVDQLTGAAPEEVLARKLEAVI